MSNTKTQNKQLPAVITNTRYDIEAQQVPLLGELYSKLPVSPLLATTGVAALTFVFSGIIGAAGVLGAGFALNKIWSKNSKLKKSYKVGTSVGTVLLMLLLL
tara:strand:- start:7595 stop:7900 length:306 start_codon:yes stop_codon:yes gene_type:complete